MKRIVSVILVCVMLLGCVATLASCSKILFGTYKREGLFTETTYEFDGKNVTIVTSIGSVSYTKKATYVIEKADDGTSTITFTYEEGETPDEDLKGTKSFSEGEEDGVKYIKIGGVKYIKQ